MTDRTVQVQDPVIMTVTVLRALLSVPALDNVRTMKYSAGDQSARMSASALPVPSPWGHPGPVLAATRPSPGTPRERSPASPPGTVPRGETGGVTSGQVGLVDTVTGHQRQPWRSARAGCVCSPVPGPGGFSAGTPTTPLGSEGSQAADDCWSTVAGLLMTVSSCLTTFPSPLSVCSA